MGDIATCLNCPDCDCIDRTALQVRLMRQGDDALTMIGSLRAEIAQLKRELEGARECVRACVDIHDDWSAEEAADLGRSVALAWVVGGKVARVESGVSNG
jgi:hypothetical protein